MLLSLCALMGSPGTAWPLQNFRTCFLFLEKINNRIYSCWVFVAASGPSLAVASGGCSLVAVHGLLTAVASPAAKHRLSSCGPWAQLLQGMWDLPRLGIEPVSPVLAGRFLTTEQAFSDGSDGKESTSSAGEASSILGWERSPGKGNENPLQYSCLGNPMDRGAWRAPVHEAANRLSNSHNTREEPLLAS